VSVTLAPIPSQDYAREVLPETFALWGRRRPFELYVSDFRAVADSAYGRRRHFTVGVRVDGRIVCSCKLYEREVRWGETTLRATGIGAVFTRSDERGRGYASALLGALLDQERAAGHDLAFLFSDIHPAFYERLGFVRLPSRLLALRASSLDGSPAGGVPLEPRDWAGVRRCFDALESTRAWALRRTPLVWNWMRQKWGESLEDGTQPVGLAIRRGRAVAAYAIGRRMPLVDTFVLDDFAFDGDEGRALLPALVRAGAGDLRRVGGWLPPAGARDALPRGSVRPRADAIFMLLPLSRLARGWWKGCADEALAARADATWAADHF
jgi:GNAT superfamily N-acetyltransferase